MIEADVGAQLEDVVDALVHSGRYGSKNEVLREGIRLVQERELRLADIDEALQRGLADADAGRSRSVSDAFDTLTAKYESAARSQR